MLERAVALGAIVALLLGAGLLVKDANEASEATEADAPADPREPATPGPRDAPRRDGSLLPSLVEVHDDEDDEEEDARDDEEEQKSEPPKAEKPGKGKGRR